MPEQSKPCPFCTENGQVDIIAETAQLYLVKAHGTEDDYLVIPKKHLTHYLDLPDNWWREFKLLLLDEAIPWFGRDVANNLSINQGRKAGQRVPHIHWWIIFREDGPEDGLGLSALVAQANEALV